MVVVCHPDRSPDPATHASGTVSAEAAHAAVRDTDPDPLGARTQDV